MQWCCTAQVIKPVKMQSEAISPSAIHWLDCRATCRRGQRLQSEAISRVADPRRRQTKMHLHPHTVAGFLKAEDKVR
eukprot:6205801-Pleurochrysis_carterae.AAC.1